MYIDNVTTRFVLQGSNKLVFQLEGNDVARTPIPESRGTTVEYQGEQYFVQGHSYKYVTKGAKEKGRGKSVDLIITVWVNHGLAV